MAREAKRPLIPDDVVSRELDGELVVTSLSMGGFLRLDDVGRKIWTLLEEGKDLQGVIDVLRQEFDVDAAKCRADVEAFFDDLAERGLLNWRRQKDA
jgi:Coenzyme PQQ synthesis protein D (PqqD)